MKKIILITTIFCLNFNVSAKNDLSKKQVQDSPPSIGKINSTDRKRISLFDRAKKCHM